MYVLICNNRRLSGNVGHMLLHNNGPRPYSHQQTVRLSPVLFFLVRDNVRTMFRLFYAAAGFGSATEGRLLYSNAPVCRRSTFRWFFLCEIRQSRGCRWHRAADDGGGYLDELWKASLDQELFSINVSWCFASCLPSLQTPVGMSICSQSARLKKTIGARIIQRE